MSMDDKKTALGPEFRETWERIQKATGIKNFASLAKTLNISGASVASAKKKGHFPLGWAYRLALETGLDLNYALLGQEATHATEPRGDVLYIDPAVQLVNEAIAISGVKINARQKKALVDIVREELKSKTVDMLKVMRGA